MSKQSCVIVGGSHAAAQLAPQLRQLGWEGSITVISDDQNLPYHRPTLSKTFLSENKQPDDILIRPKSAYEKFNIQFLLEIKAKFIDRVNKKVLLINGELISYDKLVLTTGARVRKLQIPGADLPQVCYLRDAKDAQKISRLAGSSKKAVIIGGGYIGLETAASLRKLGLEVTLLETSDRILKRVTTAEVSKFYTRVHTEEGVNIVTDISIKEISGNSHVEKVITTDEQEFLADFVVIGIGVTPNVELAEQVGLEINNGIVVNEYGCTNDSDILAAGDCTSHYNPLYDRIVRLESVQNATDQAKVCANTLCCQLKPYDTLPWFWSDQYDMKLQIAGLSQGYNHVVIRGDIHNGRSFSIFYLKDNQVLAVDAINKPQDFMMGKRLITEKLKINSEQLVDANVPLKAVVGG